MGRSYRQGRQKKAAGHGAAAMANPQAKKYRTVAMAQWSGPVGVDDMMADTQETKTLPPNETQSLSTKFSKSNLDDDDFEGSVEGEKDDDNDSVGSAVSLLSTLSNCTNPTFDVLHRNWNSGSSLHSDCVAVLSAVTDIIDSNGGTQTETEYLAALLSALDGLDDSQPVRIAATCYLMGLVMRKVPISILHSRFSVASKILRTRLDTMANCQAPNAVRHLLTCVGLLLRAQAASIWTEASNRQFFLMCLHFTVCQQPRVRKEARKIVQALICDTNQQGCAERSHPLANEVAEFCTRHLNGADNSARLHVLNLQAFVMHTFAEKWFKLVCEDVLKLFGTGSVQLTLTCMRTLEMTFQRLPPFLSPKLNAQIILALHDLKPLTKDPQLCNAWMVLLSKCLICLHDKDDIMCFERIPQTIIAIITCMKEGQEQVYYIFFTGVSIMSPSR